MEDLTVIESCGDCGACCMVVPVPPFVMQSGTHEALIRQVPAPLLNEVLAVWEYRLYMPEAPCLWFDPTRKGCRHYEFRPQACRDFELNSRVCHATREYLGIGEPDADNPAESKCLPSK